MTPILSALTGLAKESKDIRRYIKTAVFQEAASAPSAAESKPQNTSACSPPFSCAVLPDSPYYIAKLTVLCYAVLCCFPLLCSMVPAGSVSEQLLDVDPLSLRSLLLPYCTSIKFRVKHAASELLFQLCDEQGLQMEARRSCLDETTSTNCAPLTPPSLWPLSSSAL